MFLGVFEYEFNYIVKKNNTKIDMSLALHAEKNAKPNYKILALEQSSGALTTLNH